MSDGYLYRRPCSHVREVVIPEWIGHRPHQTFAWMVYRNYRFWYSLTALTHYPSTDTHAGRRCGSRGHREIVDRQSMIGSGVVEILPPEHYFRSIRDAQPGDGKR